MSSTPTRRTLASGLRGTDNAFGLLRLVLASAVIFSHAFYLGGWGEDPTHGWTNGQETIGGLAVVGFFIVSGYLITKSGMRTDILQFLWNRALRIYPAFLVVLLVSAFVIGPLVWLERGQSLGSYWNTSAGGPAQYVLANAQLDIHQWGINDVFASTTPYGRKAGASVFNGSLWTLAYEWRAYMVVAFFVAVGALKHRPIVMACTAAAAYSLALVETFAPDKVGALWPMMLDHQMVRLSLAFMLGATFAVLANRIVLDGRVAIVAAGVALVSIATWGWMLVGYLGLAYVLMYLAASIPGRLRRVGAVHDYSYGMYVYGFLVQQATAHLGWHEWGYVPWVMITLALTGVCAYGSWHLVERRALALKGRGPGRGLAFWARRLRSAPSEVKAPTMA